MHSTSFHPLKGKRKSRFQKVLTLIFPVHLRVLLLLFSPATDFEVFWPCMRFLIGNKRVLLKNILIIVIIVKKLLLQRCLCCNTSDKIFLDTDLPPDEQNSLVTSLTDLKNQKKFKGQRNRKN